MEQIYSEIKVKYGRLIEMDGKIYKVLSCLDNTFLDNGEGYLLTVKYLQDKKE